MLSHFRTLLYVERGNQLESGIAATLTGRGAEHGFGGYLFDADEAVKTERKHGRVATSSRW
jgi:hypothetical protein